LDRKRLIVANNSPSKSFKYPSRESLGIVVYNRQLSNYLICPQISSITCHQLDQLCQQKPAGWESAVRNFAGWQFVTLSEDVWGIVYLLGACTWWPRNKSDSLSIEFEGGFTWCLGGANVQMVRISTPARSNQKPKAQSIHAISCHFIPTILCKIPANNHCRSLETRHVLLQVSRLLRYQIFMILHGLIIYTYIYCIYIYIHHHIYTCIHGFMPPNPHVSICFCTACHLNHKSNLVPVDYFFPVQVACHSMP
jgi:hypothetical protein